MKILVVTQYFWPEEFRINDICEGLVGKGHEVDVLTGLPNYPKGRFFKGYSFWRRGVKKYKGIGIFRIFIIPRGNNNSFKLMLNYISFVCSSLLNIPRLIAKKYDRIFVFQVSPITTAIPAIIISRIKKIPSSIYIQDLWPETFYSIVPIKNELIKRMFKKICLRIYDSFDKIFIASKGYEDLLVGEGISADKITYLPQWAEKVYCDSGRSSEILEKSPDDFIITFAGNIGKAQSVETIIEAAKLSKSNSKIKWVILGDGSEFENIKILVDNYDLNDTVFLLGRKPTSDMPRYFEMSDALLVTLKNSDILKITLPAKVQSYMASGKPILAAISGDGLNTIKDSGSGLVCEAEDFQGLHHNAIAMYKMSEEERNIMGRNGTNFFNKNFERSKLLNKLEDDILKLKFKKSKEEMI